MSKKRAAVLLADGFEEIEAITPIDLLRRGGVEVITAGITRKEVTGSHGITVTSDILLEELDYRSLDAVVLPGGMPGSVNLAESHGVRKVIRAMEEDGKIIAAICAAPAVVLAPLGVLKGKKASCYPGMEQRAPETVFSSDALSVDGNIVTAQGPGKSAVFALALLQLLMDRETAEKIGSQSLFL